MKKQVQIPTVHNNGVTKWLDSKVNDRMVMNKYQIDDNTLKPYYSHYDKDCYYDNDNDNDSDMKNNDKLSVQLIENLTVEELKQDKELAKLDSYRDHILLHPNTNRYHANYLFRKLVDYSYDNKLEYLYPNPYKKELINLMDKSLKESFYRFCHNNS